MNYPSGCSSPRVRLCWDAQGWVSPGEQQALDNQNFPAHGSIFDQLAYEPVWSDTEPLLPEFHIRSCLLEVDLAFMQSLDDIPSGIAVEDGLNEPTIDDFGSHGFSPGSSEDTVLSPPSLSSPRSSQTSRRASQPRTKLMNYSGPSVPTGAISPCVPSLSTQQHMSSISSSDTTSSQGRPEAGVFASVQIQGGSRRLNGGLPAYALTPSFP